MTGRKTTLEERLKIIEELIKHDVNYNWAAEEYQVSYQQVYGWYQKYRKSGNDPESLRDRRGKAKPDKDWTEVDRLKAENRLLKAQLKNREMEIAFAKKLVEIRNREVNEGHSSKQSKNWTKHMADQLASYAASLRSHAMVTISGLVVNQANAKKSRMSCIKWS